MRRLAAVVVGLALVAAAGCSSDVELPTSGPVAVYRATGEGGFSAQLIGELQMGDDCVTVVDEQGTSVVPVFPDAATWRQDRLEFSGSTYAAGTVVDMGGGIADGLDGAYLPPGCDDDLQVFIVHQDTTSLDVS